MKLCGIDFEYVLGASGVQGFFGEGYRFHKPWKLMGLDFSHMTFVSKTATLAARQGNMPLTPNFTPRQLFPGCVKAKLLRGVMLNAVGLSNPGLEVLLKTGQWQKRTKPFWISIMSLADTPQARLDEIRSMVRLLQAAKSEFSTWFGLQINLSCPNTKHDPRELIGETADVLSAAGSLGVPLMPKFSIATAPIRAIMELNDNPYCDAICVSNTLPFGWPGVDWQKVWGSKTSPLVRLGGGGLSGQVLCPLVCEWIQRLRNAGFTKPINGGGGIMCSDDVHRYYKAGASSIFVGSVAVLRPWRVAGIIRCANNLYAEIIT